MSATSLTCRRSLSFCRFIPLSLIAVCPLRAQTSTGTIEGRVFNSGNEQRFAPDIKRKF